MPRKTMVEPELQLSVVGKLSPAVLGPSRGTRSDGQERHVEDVALGPAIALVAEVADYAVYERRRHERLRLMSTKFVTHRGRSWSARRTALPLAPSWSISFRSRPRSSSVTELPPVLKLHTTGTSPWVRSYWWRSWL